MSSLPPKIRIVTAASLFDGHDAAINIMRRILQSKGVEIIHLGHNRSVHEIVECAIEEDAHGVAITSYQGGHVEFFKYMKELLDEAECGHIKIFGGGGGTILPAEVEELHRCGISRIYTPDDGRAMGLEGMIEDVINQCREIKLENSWNGNIPLGEQKDIRKIARAITEAENGTAKPATAIHPNQNSPVIGITGTGGSGKSSVTDEIVRRFLNDSSEVTIAVISVDPSKKKTGGALLGDRIRMNAISHPRVYMRSLATRDDNTALSVYVKEAISICKAAGYEMIILESAGIGQSDTAILDYCDVSIYVMTPEYGAASQLEKINMLDYADLIAINKSDKPGASDAFIDVKKQYKRNHALWTAKDDQLPVIRTIAAQFNDPGINSLYARLLATMELKLNYVFHKNRFDEHELPDEAAPVIPPKRARYLSEIADNNRAFDKWVIEQSAVASNLYKLQGAKQILTGNGKQEAAAAFEALNLQLDPECKKLLDNWKELNLKYSADNFSYPVRDKSVNRKLIYTSLSGTDIRKVMLPKYHDWGDILKWQLQENVPGEFPYTAGVFSLKRDDEDPIRMFAGEGGPERTNKRFHYLSHEQPAIRLSTAFDSVTLYGEDPDERPDIFGKIGNAGVSVATLDDAKKLYSGIDLCDPKTSVSMTINGPAPVMLAFFLNTAIDQQCDKYVATSGGDTIDKATYNKLKSDTLKQVRGTVQADILKEDQAQNTCIFSTEFALKLMGDVQQYFIDNEIRNFYSVSISGYHIAEAGANPVTQLAFTLANGFTYLEYYLSRGMHIDDFAPNLSFFFSNGMDPEYSVIGRVARRIWAKAIKHLYKGNERSQKLKYHIQTSGRSLHAQEIDFNDIRTTLQALYAIYDNCNSLHTNAYDEAITTPTEESVRRAMAIQLIINRELGTAKNENPTQGSFLIEELTDLVEAAVLAEFDRLSERGGVLGAMERMYQRNKIQEESLNYESMKHSGELPIVGVNTFLNKKGSPTVLPGEVIRSTEDEKKKQIENLRAFKKRNESKCEEALKKLQHAAVKNQNVFSELMDTVKYCSLGQITHALYEVGGQYRRSM
ncbi:MAG TPA: fused isobutyryl-CoA mutase/GTPase IcmF [Flavitalea sp.]|nr:fused isobutyryl-CoA mutase/GTPase IcmF [Flavitalea sp.]